MTATEEKRVGLTDLILSASRNGAPEIVVPNDVCDAGRDAIEHYIAMINAGESRNMAEMCALQRAPGVQGDLGFFEGRHTLAQQFAGDERGLNTLLRSAKRHGFTPRYTDVYEPGLCRPEVGQGDPQAFISPTDGRSHAMKIREKMLSDEPQNRKKPVRLANSLTEKFVKKATAKDPSFARLNKHDQRAEVVRRHGSKGA